MFRRLAAALLLRRISRDLDRLVEGLAAQNALLARLVDRLAPEASAPDRVLLHADTGLSHLDDAEAGRALAFVERTSRATGHIPDDDEVLSYLADERTTDLAARLTERDAERARRLEWES